MTEFSPTATMVIETLVARYRAGDPAFTFDKRLTNVLKGLADQGVINYKHGPGGGWLVWFASDTVRDQYLMPGYRSTFEIERDEMRARLDAEYVRSRETATIEAAHHRTTMDVIANKDAEIDRLRSRLASLTAKAEPRVMVERPKIRNSWSQRDAFFASSFALVGTENADGTTNLVPYQLSLPYRLDSDNPQVLLIARRGARTETNLMRKPGNNRAVFNFIQYDRDLIEDITFLGSPYVSKEDKAARNPFTFDPESPLRILEAVQVFECSLDSGDRTDRATYLTCNLDKILVDARYADHGVPHLPITYGCRNGNQMWFSAPGEPFYVPFPIPEGTDFAAYQRGVPQ